MTFHDVEYYPVSTEASTHRKITYPEREVERGWPPLEVEVVARDIRPLGGALVGDEWWDRVSGLTITALGDAGDGSRVGSADGPTQLQTTSFTESHTQQKIN